MCESQLTLFQILVHGEKNNMMRLKSKLLSLNADKTIAAKIYSPANCEELRIPFKADKVAKVVGKLAQMPPPTLLAVRKKLLAPDANGKIEDADEDDDVEETEPTAQPQSTLITGVLVQNDFKMSLMAPEDLREYAGLTTTVITCRERLTLAAAGPGLIQWALEGTFGSVEVVKPSPVKQERSNGVYGGGANGVVKKEDLDEVDAPDETVFRVMDCIEIRCAAVGGAVDLEWEGSMVNDNIADAVMAALLTVESSPAAVKRTLLISAPHLHHFPFQCPEKQYQATTDTF